MVATDMYMKRGFLENGWHWNKPTVDGGGGRKMVLVVEVRLHASMGVILVVLVDGSNLKQMLQALLPLRRSCLFPHA